ncbi:MAG: protein-L-isoaspartate(D-aspartate) O-methyltransferase [Sedimentisphaerales bacterium]|nr:protein-L-isoaspartate(D-aspartate) O-methyltransferase [Sedimentisphaerales bacterium]
MQKPSATPIMGAMLRPNDSSLLESARRQMLQEHLQGRGIVDADVLRVMAQIPRERFVPPEHRDRAYADGPLPIGEGQTISQPYIVALMTQLLRVNRDCEVLEIGTGSGYQTVILAGLARRVYTIERLPEMSAAASKILSELGIGNVEFRVGDGSCGWPDDRTFDRILITAAIPDFPPPLTAQLVEGGMMVAPIGQSSVQQLTIAEKHHGKLVEKHTSSCRFVRLIGEHGFPA